MQNQSRRSFIKKSAIAMAGAGLYSTMPYPLYGASPGPGRKNNSNSPANRLNIGVIGAGFGVVNMRSMIEGDGSVHCTGLCDVNRIRLEERAGDLRKRFPENTPRMKLYPDFRNMLEDKDIDGVIIATPDHWHTYMYAEACKAGKAVFIEKPTGHTIEDCHLMVDLQRKHNNVVTTGLWQISLEYFTQAFDILRSGVLGDVYKAHAWITGGTDPVTFVDSPEGIPEGFDYKMWLGPAPERPYVSERVRRWSRFWDYGGGQQTNWVHYLDSAFDGLAALGYRRTYPGSVYSVGYRHPETMYEVPAVQTSVFQFDDYHVVWEHQASNLYNRGDGVAWIGSNGTLVCNRTGYEVIPRMSGGEPVIEPVKVQGPYGNQFNHMIDWGECIRNNNPDTNGNIEKGCYATLLATIANISYKTGSRSLEYLPGKRRFRDNREADSYIASNYHNKWKYPRL
jgi:predicted dehydrogenase